MKESPWRAPLAPLLQGGFHILVHWFIKHSCCENSIFFASSGFSARYILIKILEDYLHKLMWCALKLGGSQSEGRSRRGWKWKKLMKIEICIGKLWVFPFPTIRFICRSGRRWGQSSISFHCALWNVFLFLIERLRLKWIGRKEESEAAVERDGWKGRRRP